MHSEYNTSQKTQNEAVAEMAQKHLNEARVKQNEPQPHIQKIL